MPALLTIGRAARESGLTPDTLRYYERLRLLQHPKRSAGGFRLYDGRALDQLRLIRHARAIGLSLADARALFAQSPSGADCNRVREIIERKIEELDRRVAEIERFRGELADYRARCDAALGRKERRCPIFETA